MSAAQILASFIAAAIKTSDLAAAGIGRKRRKRYAEMADVYSDYADADECGCCGVILYKRAWR